MKINILLIPAILLAIATPLRSQNISTAEWDALKAAQKTPREASPLGDSDATTRFIFFSVLEGLYEDGISDKDVAQILMKKPGTWHYYNFVYACPICTPTIWALEAYQSRPKKFYSMKNGMGGTFGDGKLPDDIQKQLYSDDAHQRLAAINTLFKGWFERHMDGMRLTDDERAALMADLEKKRKDGGRMLHPSNEGPTAYDSTDTECAICNAAAGKVWKAPAPVASPSPQQNLMHQ